MEKVYENLKKRTGVFFVSQELLEQKPDLVQRIMSNCIVVRAEYLFTTAGIEYVAISNEFEEIKEGESAKLYDWRHNDETDELRPFLA